MDQGNRSDVPTKTKQSFSSRRSRTAGVRTFSSAPSSNGSSQFAQVVSAYDGASSHGSESEKSANKIVTIFLIVGAILVALAIVVLGIRHFNVTGVGSTTISDFNNRIEYHDQMNCVLYQSEKSNDDDFLLAAMDGWSRVFVRKYSWENDVFDVYYYGDALYFVNYDESGKIVKDKSIILSLSQFEKRTGMSFFETLKLSEDDSRLVKCNRQDKNLYVLPDKFQMNDLRSEVNE